jgi:ABC-2 type transport system ATP-binding protein
MYFQGGRSSLNSSPSIQAVELSKAYGSFVALSKLNLKMQGAKCVGFLGPNGAGKTTTLKIFTDLIHQTSGEALINGIDVHENKKGALATTATLIETPEIYPSLTPREALNLVAEMRGVPREMRQRKIEDVIHEVRMDEWADKRVGKFSKGMKQRIAVASTLLNDPEIILLDEPTSGLDPRGMSEVRKIVKSLKRSRLIFMSSHLLPEVTDVCDEIAMIDHGKLLVHDTINSVTRKFSDGENVVEVGLVSPSYDAVHAVENLQGIADVEELDPTHLRLRFAGGPQAQAKILSQLVALDLGVSSYKNSASALEDVYLNLIQETL